MKNHLFISVMGTLGVGKTTAVGLLAKKLHAHPAYETFEENVFLPRFYKDMKRWGFTYQVFFLLEKIKQLHEIIPLLKTSTVIQDASLLQYVYSYAQAQYQYGNMDEDEWKLYIRLYENLNTNVPTPDLIIYLDTSVDSIMKRIASRARNMEANVPRSYIELLHTLNKKWIANNTSIPVYTINTEQLNLVSQEEDKEEFLTSIKAALHERSLTLSV